MFSVCREVNVINALFCKTFYVVLKTNMFYGHPFSLQVTEALSRAGLESSNLIVGIDFTKSNEWTGLLE